MASSDITVGVDKEDLARLERIASDIAHGTDRWWDVKKTKAFAEQELGREALEQAGIDWIRRVAR